MAFSTTDAEYIVATEAIKGLWLKEIINKLGINQKAVVIHCDSQSALYLMKNHVYHKRTKHIGVRMHFVRDIIA